MESDLRLRAKDIDASLLGNRLREARVRAGLTQGEVAGDDASTAYISRIESGTRRPSAALLQRLSVRLDIPIDELLAPAAPPPQLVEDEQRVRFDILQADLALKAGEVDRARDAIELVLTESSLPGNLRRQALHVKALALESQNHVNDAINVLEDLSHGPVDLRLVEIFMALSRCYRVTGDFHRAAEVGDRADQVLDDEFWVTTEGVRLTMTISAAHYERGDVNHAIRICARVLDRAETFASPQALAAAYWNMSVYLQRQGSLDEAVKMAERALDLFDPADDARHIARLRTQLGRMELRTDPPQTTSAIKNLVQSQREMAFTNVGPADRMTSVIELARAHFLDGNVDDATFLVESILAEDDASPLVLADAEALRGHIDLKRDKRADAIVHFQRSIQLLQGLGADRYVGELWIELAGVFEELEMTQEAMAAYRGAAATSGLIVRSSSSMHTR